MSPAPSTARPSVLIVSRNAETVEALTQYFSGAGLIASGGASVDALADGRAPTGWVLFPDDFPPDAVDRELSAIDRCAPESALILVTAAPKRFAERTDRTPALAQRIRVVLGKPAWAWTILDAILGRLDPTTEAVE